MMVRFGILEYVTEKGKEEGENVLDSKKLQGQCYASLGEEQQRCSDFS